MKVLFIIGIFIFSLNGYSSNRKVEALTFKEFKSLNYKQKVAYLKVIHYVLNETAKRHKADKVKFSQLEKDFNLLENLFSQKAWADTGKNCFFAGWIFKRSPNNRCSFNEKPKLANMCKGWSSVPCNPLIFGTQKGSGKPYCTTRNGDATKGCYEKSTAAGEESYKRIVTSLEELDIDPTWDELNKEVKGLKKAGKKIELWTPAEQAVRAFCPPPANVGRRVKKSQEGVCDYLDKMKTYVLSKGAQSGGNSIGGTSGGTLPPTIPPYGEEPPSAIDSSTSGNDGWNKLKEIMKKSCGDSYGGSSERFGECSPDTYNPPLMERISEKDMEVMEKWASVHNAKISSSGDQPKDLFLKYFGVSFDEARYTFCGKKSEKTIVPFNKRIREVRYVQSKTLGYLSQNINKKTNIFTARKAISNHPEVENYLVNLSKVKRKKLGTSYDKFYQCALESSFHADGDEFTHCKIETILRKEVKNWLIDDVIRKDLKSDNIFPLKISRMNNYRSWKRRKEKREYYIYDTKWDRDGRQASAEEGYGTDDWVNYWDAEKNELAGAQNSNIYSYQRYICHPSAGKASGSHDSGNGKGAK